MDWRLDDRRKEAKLGQIRKLIFPASAALALVASVVMIVGQAARPALLRNRQTGPGFL